MVWLLFISLAMAGKPWDGQSPDVVVERDVAAPVSKVVEALGDFQTAAQIYPAACVGDWEFGTTTQGVGGMTRVTYRMAGMKRRLTAKITRLENHVVEYDHDSKKGFITQWRLEDHGDSTHVSLGTYINAPPWPFRGYYFKKVHPAWMDCYAQTMDSLSQAVTR